MNNLRKRNRLIAKLTAAADVAGGDKDFDALTDADRRAVAAARRVPDPHPVVSKRALDVPGGLACGRLHVYPRPVEDLRKRFLPAARLNFALLMEGPSLFLGRSTVDVLEYLLRWQRAAEAAAAGESAATVDVAEFFDGNGDRTSIAPNVVREERGPSFELFRDTLLAIAGRRHVAGVGVEIGEFPNPDHPDDDDVWPAAERVFTWTTEPMRTVRDWVKPLRPTAVVRRRSRRGTAAEDNEREGERCTKWSRTDATGPGGPTNPPWKVGDSHLFGEVKGDCLGFPGR